MNKEQLIELKKKISELSSEELKERDLYLRGLATGEIQGPPVGYASIDKPWLKYHTAEALMVDFEPMSAYDLLYKMNKEHFDDEMIEYFGNTFTYREVFKQIDLVAKSLIEIGVTKDDVVMMALPNSPEAAFLFYAVNKIGATINTIDPRYSHENLLESVLEAQSKFFFATSMMMKNLEGMPSELKIINVSPYNSLPVGVKQIAQWKEKLQNKNASFAYETMNWVQFLKYGKKSKIKVVNSVFEPDKGNIICHTGGSTGTPKGVVLTNENFNGLVYQLLNNNVGLERGLTFLNILPPFVAMGLDDGLHLAACAGIKQYLIPSVKPEDFPAMVLKYKPNMILCGPVHCEMMMQEISDNEDLSFINLIMYGGGEYENKNQVRFNDFLTRHNCNIKLYAGYGATETASGSACQKESCYKLGRVGAPYLKCVDGIFNPETGEEIRGINEVGELYVAGPTVMKGYYGNRSDETKDVIFTDEVGVRWYKSGDLVHFDEDGMLAYDGRIKRIITRSAFKIYPQYIESLILQHPYVRQCAVVGVPDERELSIPVANIVLNEEYADNQEAKKEVMAYCDLVVKDKISEFAVMAGYNFWTELPQTAIGKLDFKALEKIGIVHEEVHKLTKKKNNKRSVAMW